MKQKFYLLLLSVGIFFFAGYPAQAATFTVARDGSGDYNCDGSADQVQINQALQAAAKSPGSVVHLKPGRYVASDTIAIGNSTTLEGEPGTVVTFAESFWPYGSSNDALIENNGSSSSKGKNTIVLRGFEIDGDFNNDNRGDSGKTYGKGRRNFINIMYNNLEIYDMYWRNSPGDGVKVRHSDNVNIHNVKIDTLGHDGIVLVDCHNGQVWNNSIKTRVNAGIRLFGSGFIQIHDNFIYAAKDFESPGGPGLELQRGVQGGDLHDLEVYNNLIYNTCQAGIQLIGFDSPSYTRNQVGNIHIHHNIIAKCGWHGSYDWMAGIVTGGIYNVVIENNTLDGNHGGGIVYLETQGLQSNGTSGKYDIYVRNNIVTNTVKRAGNKSGSIGAGDYTQSGQGIINYNTAEATMTLENNLVYGNVGGDYKNVSSSSDVHEDPLYADAAKGDYHLKSIAGRWDPVSGSWVSDSVSSPGIDAGLASSDYSNEPEDNGDRINVGRYGNTTQASLSGKLRQSVMPAAPAEDSFQSIGGTPVSGSEPYSGPSNSDAADEAYDKSHEIPKYYDPGRAVLAAYYYQPWNPAALPAEIALEALYPGLGESAPTAVDACTDVAESAGLIPCGRHTNDPATSWNECDECDFCSVPLALQLTLDFLIKAVGVFTLLAIILGQLLAMMAVGSANMMAGIKSVLGKALVGFGYVLAAWVIVNTLLALIGYTDPLDGQWYTMC